MRNLIKTMIIGLFAATPAFSGGWEASRLDTSMMYNDDGYAEVGTSYITYDINGTTQAPASVTHKMAKNQTRTAIGFKTQLGDFDIGLSKYMSGAIQLDGQATAAQPNCTALLKAANNFTLCSVVPKIASIAILSVKKYLISNSGTVSSSTFASPPIEVTDFSSGSKFKTLRPTNHFPALLKAVAS